jgi:hypothetical protein
VSIKKYSVDCATGLQRGYSFIHYAATTGGRQAAQSAVEALGKTIDLQGLRLFLEYSRNFKKSIQIIDKSTVTPDSNVTTRHS